MSAVTEVEERAARNAVLSPASLLARAERLARDLAAHAAARDLAGEPAREAYADAYARIRADRLGALRVPARLGGAGGSVRDLATLVITLASGDSSVAQALLPHFVFVERTLLMATPAQVDDYLGRIAGGALVGGASAERGTGVRGEVHTLLRREGNGYRLDGIKHYSTGALIGDLVKVTAVDDAGDSVLVVLPAGREGIRLLDDWDGMGQRGTVSGTSHFENVAVAGHEVLRTQRWSTERHHTGAASQIVHCGIQVGIALAALRDAVAWGRRGLRGVKESGVAKPQDDPYVLQVLGDISAQAEAARALTLHAADQVDAAARARFGDEASAEDVARLAAHASVVTAQAKVIATQAGLHAGQALFDVGGAATTLREHNFDRHWRNARTHATHDPVAYKLKAVGNALLNDVAPPVSYLY
ncbi:Acyl-CoA dehydrogenase; probable dibenzothiophene desulfurization enzyme [plant metagenome]|uniref:Acyl-CoA dehydrogenase probable dibenzothiophene desulfurization enzyme n=1 Tax=plant metagenome TaxID=1297885 RepID=A0A484RL30_9ZZZZ